MTKEQIAGEIQALLLEQLETLGHKLSEEEAVQYSLRNEWIRELFVLLLDHRSSIFQTE